MNCPSTPILLARLIVLTLIAVMLLSACARYVRVYDDDGNLTKEIPKTEYMATQQQEYMIELAKSFAPAVAGCSPEMTEVEGVSCNMSRVINMLLMDRTLQAANPDGYWQFKAAKWNLFGDVIRGPGSALTAGAVDIMRYGWGGKADAFANRNTEVYFGNRTARGGGAGGERGSASTSASGDTSFERVHVTIGPRSPIQTGDGTQLGEESQQQFGDGNQAQAQSRPISQPNPEPDGDLTNNSEGASGEITPF